MRVGWQEFAAFLDGADRSRIVREAWDAAAHPHDAPAGPHGAAVPPWPAPDAGGPAFPGTLLVRPSVRVGDVSVDLHPTAAGDLDAVPSLVLLHDGEHRPAERRTALLLDLLGRKARDRGRGERPALLDVARGVLVAAPAQPPEEPDADHAARVFASMWRRFDRLASRLNIYSYLPAGTDLPAWDLDQVRWHGVRDVLDVGCGSGRHLRRLRGRGLRTLGVDPSPGAVRSATADGVPACVVGDAARLPVPDSSADLVLAMHMLYNLADIDRGLREIRRALRPGGTLLAGTCGPDHLREFDTLFRASVRAAADGAAPVRQPAEPSVRRFDLDTGAGAARRVFGSVRRRVRNLPLAVTEPEAVIAYVHSTRPWRERDLPPGVAWGAVLDEVRRRVVDEVRRTGAFPAVVQEGVLLCS